MIRYGEEIQVGCRTDLFRGNLSSQADVLDKPEMWHLRDLRKLWRVGSVEVDGLIETMAEYRLSRNKAIELNRATFDDPERVYAIAGPELG